MRRVRMIVFTVIVALAACMSTTEQRSATTGTPAAADVVELRLDERYVDPAGGLEVQPTTIGVNRATLAVRVDGIVRTLTLTVGALGRETIAPYTFELTGTTMEPTVTLLITRE